MAAASGISNSIKQLSGSISIALLTTIMTARTALHAAHESAPQQQLYIEGITDDFLFVTLVTLGSLLPFLWLLRRRRHTPEPSRATAPTQDEARPVRATAERRRLKAGAGKSRPAASR